MQFSVSTKTPNGPICEGVSRCRANLEHESQSWPDFCPDLSHFQNESLFQLCKLFPPRPLEITRKSRSKLAPASLRGGNHVKGLKIFHLHNGSSQGQHLALIVLYVPSSLDSGGRRGRTRTPAAPRCTCHGGWFTSRSMFMESTR